MKVLAITGYKPHELGIFNYKEPAIKYIKKAIKKSVIPFVEEGLEWVVISGQVGVELWAAEVVLDLQEEYPFLQLAILTPFLHQEKKWKDHHREYYEMILAQADLVESITKKEYENPVQFRLKNEFITSKTDGLLLVYDQEREGTPKYQLEVAKKKQEQGKYSIFTITFDDLQVIVEEDMQE
ncbi:DUF1273 domain-containing protein [Bacillus sp. FJAT-47783]|uniref:DUF1273 domain-containing protein n=1 Tax=Bacillus sp. FJAT-47783 TaxID=2922712 RepID=UPI001FABB453|nr:DUF1273 domain-containing protein [Bacillus sp. FJAT-47783]